MKKYLLLALVCCYSFTTNAQKVKDKKPVNDSINRWSFEVNVGQSKGVKPYSTGYFSSNPDQVFGSIRVNYYNVGARYMFSPKFGLKLDFSYDKMSNNPKSTSLPFEVKQYRVGLQGVINAARLLNIEENLGRMGLLVHAGIQVSTLTPQMDTDITYGRTKNRTEYDGGVMFGISPQYRITKKIAIVADFTMLNNFRQHFNWNGAYSDQSNNLSGQLISGSLGLSFSLGSEKLHGDWAVIPDKNLLNLQPLEKRVGEIETLMNDSDKDGVPDYLDQENNSVAGVAVDSRGKMVDLNKNGVPDELEKYLQNTYANKDVVNAANTDMIKRLINEGYVSTYFETNKTTPTDVSTDGIDFMLTYLRNNPSASIDILGHADEIGSSERNAVLATGRAEAVKSILVKAGINASRMNVISKGEDTSVAADSDGARRLVRRVTFKTK